MLNPSDKQSNMYPFLLRPQKDFLKGYHIIRLSMSGFMNDTKSALSNLFFNDIIVDIGTADPPFPCQN